MLHPPNSDRTLKESSPAFKRSSLSLVVITLNEELNLQQCLGTVDI
jgi:hypothetical protein